MEIRELHDALIDPTANLTVVRGRYTRRAPVETFRSRGGVGYERGVHREMNEKVPDEIKYSLHFLMIRHGREYCTARNPDCGNIVCDRYCSCEGC